MILINRQRPTLAVLAFVMMHNIGCNTKPAAVPTIPVKTASSVSRPVSLISPVEFFPPEQKRLAQHLNWYVGCFKVEYTGSAATLTSRLETWTQGRPEPRGGGSSSMEAGTGEVSISVQETAGGNSNYQVKLVQSSDSGSSSSSGGYNRPDLKGWSTRVIKLPNPTELKPGEEIVVWALCLFKNDVQVSSNANEPLFDVLKKSDWAIVLKVGLDPPTSQ